MKANLSVLMSVYYKEKPDYLRACFDSLLNQSIQASEWVLVKDGPLTVELEKVINEYQLKNEGLLKIIKLNTNVGLGLALREGVSYCTNELIARMDTDDIAREDRFELQLKEFKKNANLDICGSHIIEFDKSMDNVISKRIVPLTQQKILIYQKRRSAFNHMTVMFRKKSVINAGNYEHCPLMEDDMLWIRMLLNGAECMNIDDYLVYARVGLGMIKRRGSIEYFKKYKVAKKKFYELRFISYFEYLECIFIQSIVAILPPIIRQLVFTNLLRK